jgi:fructose-1,6-bisphosphatase I
LLYEAAPLAMIVEQAGGAASTGAEQILDVQPASLHQKVPLIIGSREDVVEYNRFFKEAQQSAAD